MIRTVPFLPLLLLLGGLVPLPAQKPAIDPVIAEFKRYADDKDPAVRRDQMERLARVQSAEAATLLIQKGLTDPDQQVRDRAVWALSQMSSPEARQVLVEALDSSKEEVREGAAAAAGAIEDWGTPPLARLMEMLEKDRDDTVRVAAAEALGALGDRKATPALAAALGERDEGTVIAAADALALLRDPAAAGALITLLEHGSWRVQVAALHALSRIRVKESIGPIIAYLEEAEGRPRADARQALMRITKRSFGMDARLWKDWWGRVGTDWKVPPETEKEPEEQDAGSGYARRQVTYHRIPTWSQRILFVIDVSTSMETPILLKAGRKPDAPEARFGTPKIEIAREELAATLRSLDPETKFNVIAFETDVRLWKKEAVRADPGAVQQAIRWIERQKSRKPSNVAPSSGLDSEGRMIGRTNTYGALRAAFGLSAKRESGGTTRTPGAKAPRPPWDTIYFLSDGIPTEGEITDIDEILKEVERWNKSGRVVIHTIGMEHEQSLANLLEGLARLTGGRCEFVGK